MRSPARTAARRFVQWVRTASSDEIAEVMRGWRRRPILWIVFRAFDSRLDRAEAAGLDETIEFRVRGRRNGGHDRWQVRIAQRRVRARRDGDRDPRLTLEMSAVTFLRLVTGARGAPGLLLRGRIRAQGDLLWATELPKYFRVPRERRPG
jgi:SCP-2 sterol transfer family protein